MAKAPTSNPANTARFVLYPLEYPQANIAPVNPGDQLQRVNKKAIRL
jgi:hypothetical protein